MSDFRSPTPDDLRAFRSRHGISQRELCRWLGVGPTTVKYWEDGTNSTLPYLAVALAYLDEHSTGGRAMTTDPTRQHRPDPAGQPDTHLTDEEVDALYVVAEERHEKYGDTDTLNTLCAIHSYRHLRAQLRATEERAEFERQNAERIQRARQRTEEECERRVRAAEEERDGASLRERKTFALLKSYQRDHNAAIAHADIIASTKNAEMLADERRHREELVAERSLREAAEERAGRLRALLTEAMEQTVGVYGLDEIRARVAAELVATAAPQPSEEE